MVLKKIHLTTAQWKLEWICTRQSHLWEWKHQKGNRYRRKGVRPSQRKRGNTRRRWWVWYCSRRILCTLLFRELLCFVVVKDEWEKHSYDQERLGAHLGAFSFFEPSACIGVHLQSLVVHGCAPARDPPSISCCTKWKQSPAATHVMTWDADFIIALFYS